MAFPMKCATALLAAAVVAGCATGGRASDAERLALYRDHAGAPVDSFPLLGGINGWTPLGDRALAVWTRPREAFLLELQGPCHDLEYATSIGLTSSVGRVQARFDRVLVRGPVGIPCAIGEIRPLDVRAIKASEKELREARVQERDAADAAD